MVRDFSKDFEGKCCEDDFRTCDWTCAEIQNRINTRAAKGSTYTRSEVDTLFGTLNSLYSTLIGSSRAIFNTELYLTTNGVPLGLLDPADNTGNFYYATDTFDLYLCDGTTWILIVDFSLLTSPIDPNDVMFKSVYDTNDDGFLDISAGGFGADNSASQGIVTFQSGGLVISDNYMALDTPPPLTSDYALTITDNPVQVFTSNTDYQIILPLLPPNYIWFRLINKAQTNTLQVRDDVGGTVLFELNVANGNACDFHWDGNDWNVIPQTLV